MDEERQVQKVWKAGRNHSGGPRTTWNNSVAEMLEGRGIDWRQAKKLADNREEWWDFIINKL